jgi:hypothetical protein
VKARWPVIVIISLFVAILVAVIVLPIWLYNAHFNGMMSATSRMTNDTLMVTNQTDHVVKVLYQGTNGDDVINVQQTIPQSETVFLMLIGRNAKVAHYLIDLKPSEKSQAKRVSVKWGGSPKSKALIINESEKLEWIDSDYSRDE